MKAAVEKLTLTWQLHWVYCASHVSQDGEIDGLCAADDMVEASIETMENCHNGCLSFLSHVTRAMAGENSGVRRPGSPGCCLGKLPGQVFLVLPMLWGF